MTGRLKWIGIITVILIGTAVIVAGNSGQRTVYQPINLMGGTAADINSLATITQAAILPTTASTDLSQTTILADTTLSQLNNQNGPLHTVQSGENLYRIALQYNLTAENIAAANGISDVTQIYEGQTLVIPLQRLPDGSFPTPQTAAIVSALPTAAAIEGSGLPTPISTYPPPPNNVNGIAVETIVVMPQGVIEHIRNIFSMGQSIGRNPRALSKLGDSTIENPHFLTRFDSGPYNLGEYTYLQDVVGFYNGSFSRDSAIRRGLQTWAVLDPMWAGGLCEPGENVLACELRVQNPSILIIHLGSNDAGVPDSTNRNLREIIEYCITNGVIPILGTKADRQEGSNINNEIIRQIAYDYNLPLWDFDAVAATIPGKGLDQDGVHMTSFFAHDWTSPIAFERGYGLMNLTALLALDKVWRAVSP